MMQRFYFSFYGYCLLPHFVFISCWAILYRILWNKNNFLKRYFPFLLFARMQLEAGKFVQA